MDVEGVERGPGNWGPGGGSRLLLRPRSAGEAGDGPHISTEAAASAAAGAGAGSHRVPRGGSRGCGCLRFERESSEEEGAEASSSEMSRGVGRRRGRTRAYMGINQSININRRGEWRKCPLIYKKK